MASAPKIDPPIPIRTIVLNFLNFLRSLIVKLILKFLFKILNVFFGLLISEFACEIVF